MSTAKKSRSAQRPRFEAAHPTYQEPKITRERVDKYLDAGQYGEHNLWSMIYETPYRQDCVKLAVFSPPPPGRIAAAEAVKGAFQPAKVGDAYGPGWSTHWFRLDIEIPEAWRGREVHLLWDSESEAMVWSNDLRPLQGLNGGDKLHKDRRGVFILATAADDLKVTLYIEMACNALFGCNQEGHFLNPPDLERKFTLKECAIALFNRSAFDVWNKLRAVNDMAKALPAGTYRKEAALFVANRTVNLIDPAHPRSLQDAEKELNEFLASAHQLSKGKYASEQGRFTVNAVGHCHIDTAWLWPFAETKRKCARSWSSQIRLMERFPRYRYEHKRQAQQFSWVKEDYPELYAEIREYVKRGQFVPTGGTWVEMDCNIPSGEGLARQFIFGQRFFEREFGSKCTEFWLPDTFGYSAQLPQLIQSAGMKYFVTQKLSWNNINKFPHHSFKWFALDGTPVIAHFPPSNTYVGQGDVWNVVVSEKNYLQRDRSSTSLMLYGHGDGGGGPMEHMCSTVDLLRNVPGMPIVEQAAPVALFEHLERESDALPSFHGELYFEFHRGTFTTQAKTKAFHRATEFALVAAETFATAAMLEANVVYPREKIERAWELNLLNAFHDVLPGSSIGMVYEDAEAYYAQGPEVPARDVALMESCNEVIESSIASLDGGKTGRNQRVINKSPVAISGVVQSGNKEFVFASADAKSVSDNVSATLPSGVKPVTISGSDTFVLDNGIVRAEVDRKGRVVSLVDVGSGRETLSAPGNVFVLYEDMPLFWDAWDVEIYVDEKYSIVDNLSVEKGDAHELQVSVTVTGSIGDASSISQSIRLSAGAKALEFDTKVDWNETYKLLRVRFPTAVHSDHGIFDSQYGFIRRPNHQNTSLDYAKFEVCGHKYGAIAQYDFGVALLNDSKFGYSVRGNILSLSLLKSAKRPDENADMGAQTFRYGIMPFAGDFRAAGVIAESYRFNLPLQLIGGGKPIAPVATSLADGVVLEVVKPWDLAPAGTRALVLRCHEAHGATARAEIALRHAARAVSVTNILEESSDASCIDGVAATLCDPKKIAVELSPFKVATIIVELQ